MHLQRQSKPLVANLSRTLGAKRFVHDAKQKRQSVDTTMWFRDPLSTKEKIENKRISHPAFETNILDTPRQKIIREIISRRKHGRNESKDEHDHIYELGEEYLDLEHEARALQPSEKTIIEHKIGQILQKRFNFNPVALMYEGSNANGIEDATCRNYGPYNRNARRYEPSIDEDNEPEHKVSHNVKLSLPSQYQGVGRTDNGSSDKDFQHEPYEVKDNPRTIYQLIQGVLPNGTLLTVDVSEFSKIQSKDDTQSIFDRIDEVNINADLIKEWTDKNMVDIIYFNKTCLPVVSSDPLKEYKYLRHHAVIFDMGHLFPMQVIGEHADLFLEHFVTCSLNKMKIGMLQYTCIIDTKGFVMDTGYVAKTHDGYFLITNGLNKKNLYDYMTAYQVTCANSGLNIALKPLLSCTTIGLHGPKALEALKSIAIKQQNSDMCKATDDIDSLRTDAHSQDCHTQCSIEIPDVLPPFMHCFNATFHYIDENKEEGISKQQEVIHCFRMSDVGEDGFQVIVRTQTAPHLIRSLLKHQYVITAGFEIYDVGRMEAGIIRSDVDLPTEPSPIQAAVTWSIDKQKLRTGALFGRQHMVSQIINGIAKVRVGLITNHRVDQFCTILHKDTRMPIGLITSCAWSYGLQMYTAQAYVNTEYARHDMPVCISMPLKPERATTKREYRKYYRNRTLRTFARGTVVHLPFILHNYPITESQRHYVGGRNVPLRRERDILPPRQSLDNRAMGVMSENEFTPATPSTQGPTEHMPHQEAEDGQADAPGGQQGKTTVKTRKQLWKEVVQAQRKKNSKTLEMALDQLEKMKVNSTLRQDVKQCTPEGGELLHTDRINIRPRTGVPLDKCIQYYTELHSKPITPRHRRYRPTVGQKLS